MKLKTISRSQEEYTRSRSGDIYKVFRNVDPVHHPFERAREYTRALNATKLERLFSKPFISALEGHIDGVYCIAKHQTNLDLMFSASADGELRMWSMDLKRCEWKKQAHAGFVRGLCTVPYSENFISVGDDKLIKIWNRNQDEPTIAYTCKSPLTGIDHHRTQKLFVTSSSTIDLWDHEHSMPIQEMSWGAETILNVKMNQVETNIIGSTGTDRTICLYDIRTNTPVSRAILELKSNAIAWNPMEAFNFTVANEDHNCYSFDMRNLKSCINVLKGHVSAVMDLDYSPTGQELVTCSYDKTVRLFNARQGTSRDVYHTKRMQRVFSVRFTMDGRKVVSASDDGNLRLWRTNAFEKDSFQNSRERDAFNYAKSLKERYKHMPEIKKIDRQRFLPSQIKSATRVKNIQIESQKRKQERVRQHSEFQKFTKERKKHILQVE